jgi:sulfur-oxidizing protein SoxX
MRITTRVTTATVALGLLIMGCTSGAQDKGAETAEAQPAAMDDRSQYTEMTAEELANHLIFAKEGFHLDQATQEGGTVKDRLTQDTIQTACSQVGGTTRADLSSETISNVLSAAREMMEYPEGEIAIGDWEEGAKIAKSGYGWRVGHKVDDHSERPPGGNCYACHAMAPGVPHGSVGPSLEGYGAKRGLNEGTLKYTYDVIYNPHVYYPCANMPRFGVNNVLTQNQIADVLAYLLDPESPVNQ